MALKANITEAVTSLWASKQRSLLALIGIVIGIGSVIAMLSVGTIAKHQAQEQFRELGTDYLTIHVRERGPDGRSGIRLADVVELPHGAPTIAGVAPWLRSREAVVYGGKKVVDAPTLGVTGSFPRDQPAAPRRGPRDLGSGLSPQPLRGRRARRLRPPTGRRAGAGRRADPAQGPDLPHGGRARGRPEARDPALRARPRCAHPALHRATHVPPTGVEPDGRAHARGRAPHRRSQRGAGTTSPGWSRARRSGYEARRSSSSRCSARCRPSPCCSPPSAASR